MKSCSFWVLISSILYLSLYAFFGINFSDEGYHYYEHLQAFNGFGMPWKMTFLSNYLGGLWMFFSPFGFSIFWGRIGGILLISATYGIAAAIMGRLFACKSSLIYTSCMIALVASPYWSPDLMIHYYNVPFLILELLLLCFLAAMQHNGTSARLLVCLAGIVAMIIPFSRFTLFWIPAVPLVYLMLPAVREWRSRNRAILFYLAGCMAGGLLCYLLYTVWIKQYVFFPGMPFSLMDRIKDIKNYLFKILPFMFQACGFIVFIIIARQVKKVPLYIKTLGLFAFFLLFAACIVYYSGKFSGGTGFGITVRWIDIVTHAPCILAFYLLLPQQLCPGDLPFRTDNSAFSCRLFILMICGISCLYPIGTNLGLVKILYTLPLAGSLLILVLILNAGWSRDFLHTFLFFLCLAGAGMTLFMSVFDVPRYRDSTSFAIKCAQGIRTSPRRAEYANSVVSELQKYTQKDEEVLCMLVLKYMFFTMSERRAWNHEEWQFRHDELFRRFAWTWRQKKLPRAAIVDENELTPFQTWGKDILTRFYEKKFSYNFSNSEFIVCPQPKENLVISIWTRNDRPEEEAEREAILQTIRTKYDYK